MAIIYLTLSEFRAAGPLSGGDTFILRDSALVLQALSANEIAALAPAGLRAMDSTGDALSLSVAQRAALGALALTTGDAVTLRDTAPRRWPMSRRATRSGCSGSPVTRISPGSVPMPRSPPIG